VLWCYGIQEQVFQTVDITMCVKVLFVVVRVTLACSGELTTVNVLMNSWACEFGGVSTGDCSTTTPGGFYTTAMKLSIWNGGVGCFTDTAPLALLGSAMHSSVAVPFHPTAISHYKDCCVKCPIFAWLVHCLYALQVLIVVSNGSTQAQALTIWHAS
jgi:hypothetical protein